MIPLLAQSGPPLWVYQHLPSLLFIFGFGACVGSFLNVVIFRMPEGMSVVHPPSRCPYCGRRLRFFTENLPIIGWLLVRGRCRTCGTKISPQYLLVELLVALLFVALYILFYWISPSTPIWGEIGGRWWFVNQVWRTWPIFFTLGLMVASLVAMTIIDARTFTIPFEIPLVVTILAFIAFPLQALLPLRAPTGMTWPIPGVGWPMALGSIGAMSGVVIGSLGLKLGWIRYSFEDYEKYCKEDEVLAIYPHARREMFVELLFLLPALVLGTAGWLIGAERTGVPSDVLQALCGSFAGYLMGGGLVWGIRIFGSFLFGKEAMGMGDVHLLGAIGACMGWIDPIFIFFLAPFFGVGWAIVTRGPSLILWLVDVLRRVPKEQRRKIQGRHTPYGPHLALAALVVLYARPGLNWFQDTVLETVPIPTAGFVTGPPPPLVPASFGP